VLSKEFDFTAYESDDITQYHNIYLFDLEFDESEVEYLCFVILTIIPIVSVSVKFL